MAKIIPGILTDNENDYESRLKRAQHAADLVQIDIIDGVFADNKTITVEVVKKYEPSCMLEVQLMVAQPQDYIEKLESVDFVSRVIFPFETSNVRDNIYLCKKKGFGVGLSVNPETKIRNIGKMADEIDILCIFSASPGFSGKKLEHSVYGRIKEAKLLFPNLAVEVDIGVNFETAPKLARAGADFLVATSALHNAEDFHLAYQKLAKLASGAR